MQGYASCCRPRRRHVRRVTDGYEVCWENCGDYRGIDRHRPGHGGKGLFFTVQKGIPLLNAGGAVILTGSIAALKGFPAMSVYSATKAAIRSFARTWTNELRERRTRVNVISPGHIETPIMESLQQGDALTRMKEEFARAVPLGRMGDPDEIAKVVSFLASDDASCVPGIELFVDGGVADPACHPVGSRLTSPRSGYGSHAGGGRRAVVRHDRALIATDGTMTRCWYRDTDADLKSHHPSAFFAVVLLLSRTHPKLIVGGRIAARPGSGSTLPSVAASTNAASRRQRILINWRSTVAHPLLLAPHERAGAAA